MMKHISFAFLAVVFFFHHSSFAKGGDESHSLSIGAGISSPSRTTALLENPAGIIYNRDLGFYANGASTNSSLDPLGFGGGFFWGNGSVGMAALYQTGQSASLARVAGGFVIPSLNTSIGISGGFDIDSTGGPVIGASKSVNAGLIYEAQGNYQVGFLVHDLDTTQYGFGGGLAYEFTQNATLAVDASLNKNLKGLRLKPALGIHVSEFQVTAGYGIEADKTAGSYISKDFSAGLGVQISNSAHLQFYYHQIAEYYAAILIHI